MPVRMAASFAQQCSATKIEAPDSDKKSSSFSFTQLLMNGDAWHGIDPDAATLPSVLPQSDFVVNPSTTPIATSGEYVIRVPTSSTKSDKKRKAAKEGVVSTEKAVEMGEQQCNKKQKSGDKTKDEAPAARASEPSRSQNTDNKSSKHGKENSKPADPSKQDYIHVRARRGQATDSHSLAERVRREKISERMKLLQDLVPGCSKVTGKAMMLDEIINYVQSLQRQVEFLSMKLASVKPRLELYHEDTYLVNEVLPGSQEHVTAAAAFSDLLHEQQQQHHQSQEQSQERSPPQQQQQQSQQQQHQQQQQSHQHTQQVSSWQGISPGSQMAAAASVENCS